MAYANKSLGKFGGNASRWKRTYKARSQFVADNDNARTATVNLPDCFF